jgi:hypothetical protein
MSVEEESVTLPPEHIEAVGLGLITANGSGLMVTVLDAEPGQLLWVEVKV